MLRNQVLEMIDTNETLPEIEKLERHEFNLDLEERAKMMSLREEKLKKVKLGYCVFIFLFFLCARTFSHF